MDDQQATVQQLHVPGWYVAAVPALLAALAAIVVLAGMTA